MNDFTNISDYIKKILQKQNYTLHIEGSLEPELMFKLIKKEIKLKFLLNQLMKLNQLIILQI